MIIRIISSYVALRCALQPMENFDKYGSGLNFRISLVMKQIIVFYALICTRNFDILRIIWGIDNRIITKARSQSLVLIVAIVKNCVQRSNKWKQRSSDCWDRWYMLYLVLSQRSLRLDRWDMLYLVLSQRSLRLIGSLRSLNTVFDDRNDQMENDKPLSKNLSRWPIVIFPL